MKHRGSWLSQAHVPGQPKDLSSYAIWRRDLRLTCRGPVLMVQRQTVANVDGIKVFMSWIARDIFVTSSGSSPPRTGGSGRDEERTLERCYE
eukprot:6487739-Amphidinium_carterae.2